MRAARAAGVLLLAVVLIAGVSASASAAAASRWTSARLPGLCAKNAVQVVQGSAAVSATEAWLVVDCQHGGDERSVVVHEVGGRWTKVSHPSAADGWGQPEALAASGPDDVWVFTSTGIWRHDAAAWHVVPTQGLPAGAFGPGSFDIDWFASTHPAVVQSPTRAVIVGARRNHRPVVATWDGTQWSTTALPTRSKADRRNGDNTRVSISPLPGTSRYIVAYGPSTAVGSGTSWRLLPTIAGWCKRSCDNQTIVATGKKKAYLVYMDSREVRTRYATWNGSTWKLRALPKLKTSYALTDLAATSRTSLVAVGYRYDSTRSSTRPFALRFNGKRWTADTSPKAGARSDNSVWFDRVSAVWGRRGFLVSGSSEKDVVLAYRR